MPDLDRPAPDDVGASLRALVPDLPQPADRFERVRRRIERRRRRRLALPALAAAATAALLLVVQPLGTAGRGDDSDIAAPAVRDTLSASPWYLFAYSGTGGRSFALHVPASTLTFGDSGGFEAVGCNSTSGRVSVTPERLAFSDPVSTRKSCTGAGRSLDQALARLVAGSPGWSVSSSSLGSELALTTDDDEVLRYWSSPKPSGTDPGIASQSCDPLDRDFARRTAGGPPLIPAVPVPRSFRPVAVLRCSHRLPGDVAQSATGSVLTVPTTVQERSTDAAAIARLALALQLPDEPVPADQGCLTSSRYRPPELLLIGADGRYLHPDEPTKPCGDVLDAVTEALASTPFTAMSDRSAEAQCTQSEHDATAVLSSAFATTAGAVKAHRTGPSASPAQTGWASVPDRRSAFWCEFLRGGSYSVTAITDGAAPVEFVTSNVPLLAGADGPPVP